MTTTILAAGGLIAAICYLTFVRRYIVRHTGRAQPLPDIHPDRDEATLCCADEGGVLYRRRDGVVVRLEGKPELQSARMQGNSEPRTFPMGDCGRISRKLAVEHGDDRTKHFFDERLPRRAAE